MAVSTGAGNDSITMQIGDGDMGANAWANHQLMDANADSRIGVDAGAGDDMVHTNGETIFRIDLGAGNDAGYTDNSGAQDGIDFNAGRATWVMGTSDQDSAATDDERNVNDLESAANGDALLYGARITLTYKGYVASSDRIMDMNTTTLEVNNIIKGLIQGDEHLSDLIVAEDGPGNTLVIRSLIDGVDAVAGLEVGATFAAADQWSGVSDATLALVHTANGYTAAQIGGLDTVAELNTWVTNNVANFNNHSDAAVMLANTDDLDAAAAALYAGFDDAMGQEAVLSNLDVSVTTRGDDGTDEVQSIDVSALTAGVGVPAMPLVMILLHADGSIEITVDGQVFTVDYAAADTVAEVADSLGGRT